MLCILSYFYLALLDSAINVPEVVVKVVSSVSPESVENSVMSESHLVKVVKWWRKSGMSIM